MKKYEALKAIAKECKKEWYEEMDSEDREFYGTLGQYIKFEIKEYL